MKTVALIIAEKEFRDEEYQIPHDLLHELALSPNCFHHS